MAALRRLRRDAGQSLVEYALILALIGLVATMSMQLVGGKVADVFDGASAALTPGKNGNGHGAGGNGNGNNGGGNGNSGTPPGGGGGGGKPK